MSISIIIPVRNRQYSLFRLYSSIIVAIETAATHDIKMQAQVIVVDDRSSQSPTVPNIPGWSVIKSGGAGPGAARNTGASAAEFNTLIFTDSDCTVRPDWLKNATYQFSHSQSGVVQGNPTRYQDTYLGIQEERLYSHMFKRYLAENMELTYMLDSRNLIIDRHLLLSCGGFDTSIAEATAESRTLANRVITSVGPVRYAPDVQVIHEAPQTVHSEMRVKYRHGSGRSLIWSKPPRDGHALINRYFSSPIDHGCSNFYVRRVHLAFIVGYYATTRRLDSRCLRKVLDYVCDADPGALQCAATALRSPQVNSLLSKYIEIDRCACRESR